MTQRNNTDSSNSEAPSIAVVYTHFPHYRAPVFSAMSSSEDYDFSFYYDPSGVEKTILSGSANSNHVSIKTRRLGPFLWQGEALTLAATSNHDGFIFLGNPHILSTWLAAAIGRARGKHILYWSHGWIRQETGPKAWVRKAFYNLAEMILVYGHRAKKIGAQQGYQSDRIAVINNSLDYDSQSRVRSLVLAEPDSRTSREQPEEPYFLSVTRLVPEVRLDLALDAMSRLHSNSKLVIVGDGPERMRLESQADHLGIKVEFLGAIYDEDRLARLFMNALAVVSPGKVGLLALHALGYGAAVITHNDMNKQMPEVEAIKEGLTGSFFRHDNVSDLARVMENFLNNRDEMVDQETRRRAAISEIEGHYTPTAQVKLITSALDSLVKKRGKPLNST